MVAIGTKIARRLGLLTTTRGVMPLFRVFRLIGNRAIRKRFRTSSTGLE